jgi:hypothetical protein
VELAETKKKKKALEDLVLENLTVPEMEAFFGWP